MEAVSLGYSEPSVRHREGPGNPGLGFRPRRVAADPVLAVDPDRIVTVSATEVDTKRKVTISYRAVEISGHGSFGVVLKAQLVGGGSGVVALKRTKQDRRYKVRLRGAGKGRRGQASCANAATVVRPAQNRELAIMLAISHPNIVKLRFYYYEGTGNEDEVYLNLVLDHIVSPAELLRCPTPSDHSNFSRRQFTGPIATTRNGGRRSRRCL